MRTLEGATVRRLDSRGSFLVAFAVVHVCIGLAYSVPPATPGTRRSLALLVDLGVPASLTGLAWIASGIIAATAAHWPPGRDGYGFVALMVMQAAWTVVTLASWLIGSSPRGYFLALIFAALAYAVHAMSRSVSADEISRRISS